MTTAVAPEFDPFSATCFDDPTDAYRRLRDDAPVYHNTRYGFYALSRYDDVVAAHRDWGTFSSTHGVDLSTLRQDPEMLRMLKMLIMLDPPEHTRFRKLVSRTFTPRAVASLEPMVRDTITGFLDGLEDPDHFDVVTDLSGPFPVEIISRLLGVPEGERQQIRHWLDAMLHREPGEVDPTPEGQTAVLEMSGFFLELVAHKRTHPGEDLMSELCEVTVGRDDGGESALSDNEIAGFASLLGGAGAETVTKLVASAVVAFDGRRDDWRRIGDDPGLIPGAIEEVLRLFPPSQYQGRFSVADATFEVGTIPAGYPVLLLTGAASRDPRAFENPDELDLDRPAYVSIGFGHGIHSCLGAALARLETRVALEELTRRWHHLEVDHDGLERVTMSNVAGFAHVPVRGVH